MSFPEGWGSQISIQSAHEGGKVVSPTLLPPLTPGNIPVPISVSGWVDPHEGLRQRKISRNRIRDFRIVAQCDNQLRHRVLRMQLSTTCELIVIYLVRDNPSLKKLVSIMLLKKPIS